MEFNYNKFSNDLFQELVTALQKITEEHKDLYAFTLSCSRDVRSIGVIANTKTYLAKNADEQSEDYWYYKYCENEWEIFDTFHTLSKDMSMFLESDPDKFTNPNTYFFTEEFDEHFDRIVAACDEVISRLRDSKGKQEHPNILLNFNVEDYFNGDDRIKRFKMLNGKEAAKEYEEHIEDFV
ncbi:DUF4303 domain-containing protein [Metabacillus niabensis]|uniref:DUF4303 domain-containing protein n=1 Tax=Metabacillus niabensis TaxID=324854 RepID=A0ABT9Z631_9BACI|nr:DUF4303 domain-containing protein [Metabacillus niabensis]MDQ0227711.1 hypothetical protein [Metabacillus niabensis]